MTTEKQYVRQNGLSFRLAVEPEEGRVYCERAGRCVMADPIQEKHREFMNAVARGLDDIMNGKDCPPEKKKTGFMLFVYDFEQGPKAGRMNYISNANRMDNAAAMKEIAADMEGRLHKAPKGKQ